MVTAVNLTSGSTGSSTSSVTTASVSPTANKLQLLAVHSRNFTGSAPPAPTVTGCGLTWVQVATLQHDTGPTSLKRVTLFRAMGASPSTGTLTIDFAGDSQTDVCWSLDEFTGTDTSGTNGSGAIVQTVTAKDETGSATSITATLAAFGSVNNATYGAFAHVAPTNGVTASAGSGFTALASPLDTVIGLITEFKTTNDTTVDGSLSGSSFELGMIASEIKAAAAGVTGTLSSTLSGATMSASGTVGTAPTGTLASTLAGVTEAASGTVVDLSTFATTLAGVTQSSAGAVADAGSFASTLAGATQSASGTVTDVGSFSPALAGVLMAASGQIIVTGLFASTLNGVTQSASGVVAANPTGTFASTLGGAGMSASGFVGTPPAGGGPSRGTGALSIAIDIAL